MLLYNEMNHLYVYRDSPPFSSLPVHPHPSTLGHHCKLLLQEKFRNTYNTAWIKSALCLCWWWWWGGLEMWPKGQEGICQGGCEQATFQGQNRMGKGTENYIFIECSDTKQQLKPSTAAKSLQSCPTLCDPIDGSPPGSPIPGILQARTLEWVAISFSNAGKWKVKSLSRSVVSDPSRPNGLQPTRLLCPWDFPGKSTGVGCHCLLRNQVLVPMKLISW